jgi:hypothetical protein
MRHSRGRRASWARLARCEGWGLPAGRGRRRRNGDTFATSSEGVDRGQPRDGRTAPARRPTGGALHGRGEPRRTRASSGEFGRVRAKRAIPTLRGDGSGTRPPQPAGIAPSGAVGARPRSRRAAIRVQQGVRRDGSRTTAWPVRFRSPALPSASHSPSHGDQFEEPRREWMGGRGASHLGPLRNYSPPEMTGNPDSLISGRLLPAPVFSPPVDRR